MKRLAFAIFAATLLPTVCFAQNLSGKLVLYTSQPHTDAQQTVDAFKAKFPQVDVSFVRDGTPRIMAKLRAEFEAGQPQADVLLIADSVTMEGLKIEGRLMAHESADTSVYPAGTHDAQKHWFATKLITTGIVYNTKARFKPSSWADLAKPEVRGQVVMPSPLNSGAALIHAATLTSNLEDGWKYYEALKNNGATAGGGNGDILKSVAGGEKIVGVIVDFMPIREKAKGAPVEFVFPKEGVSAVSEPVAILKSTKNPEAAKAFINFLLSAEGQELALKQGYIAAHPGIAVPDGYPPRDQIKVLPFDAAKALADETKNKTTFADIFGQ
ncbi:ABC transporter substrate-binding protein [Microvirga aerophila]|uniref:ABC transporter substrate-binding protein n=1 Tax=Microvirga aerophila TaxID=670291 RepID=A0A512BPS3_9HYPH|nr:ABC transporter substrate-binding protein [Microvirga aerophila]GEO13827.1 ABC transporter substrate-binding protein [Microvirga aerophila]